MSDTSARPLILTARLDQETQRCFDDLRRRHFPPERNYLAAHLTLFHALPGEKMEELHRELTATASRKDPVQGQVSGVRSLGRGVAFTIECRQLREMRSALARSWDAFLTAQDRQSWQLHITVQNKVEPEAASDLLRELKREFQPRAIQFPGLDLWHYDGGPWEWAGFYSFAA